MKQQCNLHILRLVKAIHLIGNYFRTLPNNKRNNRPMSAVISLTGYRDISQPRWMDMWWETELIQMTS